MIFFSEKFGSLKSVLTFDDIKQTKTENMNKQELLLRIGSKLNEDFNTERSKPDTDFRPDSEYHTAIFNALGDSMEDINSLLWG